MQVTREKYSLIDNETGEVIPLTAFLPERKDRWEKVYAKGLAELMEITGDEKTRVIACLIREKDYENRVLETLASIAKKSEVSLKTVKRTVAILQEHNFIHKVRNGLWRFSPHVMVNGRDNVAAVVYREWLADE